MKREPYSSSYENRMKREDKILKGARMLWERWSDFSSWLVMLHLNSATKNVSKLRIVAFTLSFRMALLSFGKTFFSSRPATAVFLFAVLIFCPFTAAIANGFEADGELHFTIGTNKPIDSKFKVQISGCAWAISVSDDPYYPFLEDSVIASDGTNLFQIDVFKDTPDPYATNQNGLPSPQSAPQVNRNGYARTGSVPDYNHHHNSQLWLAFASACYLRNAATNRLPCTVLRPQDEADCSVKATWTFHGNEKDTVLSSATFFDEGKIELLSGEVIDRPKPFEKGFTNLTYRVSAFTNIEGSVVPLQFHFGFSDVFGG